jgi:hypothetical protein
MPEFTHNPAVLVLTILTGDSDMHTRFTFFLCAALLAFASPLFAANSHSLGLGAHYWRVVDDLGSDFDDSGISYQLSYRHGSGLLGIQPELEVFPKDFGASDNEVFSPQILLVLGEWIYAGAGAGILYSDGDFADSPFFMLRAGFNIFGLGPVSLDINANYIFTDLGDFSRSDVKSDSITLGAMVRIRL